MHWLPWSSHCHKSRACRAAQVWSLILNHSERSGTDFSAMKTSASLLYLQLDVGKHKITERKIRQSLCPKALTFPVCQCVCCAHRGHTLAGVPGQGPGGAQPHSRSLCRRWGMTTPSRLWAPALQTVTALRVSCVTQCKSFSQDRN